MMAWSYNKRSESRKDAWSIEEPSTKKRRVGGEETMGDDWGDDSLELTQADIETIDVMASQALNTSQMPADQSMSIIGSFARPSNPSNPVSRGQRSSSSSASSTGSFSSSNRPKSHTSFSLSSDQSLSSHNSSTSNGTASTNLTAQPRTQGSGSLDTVSDYKAQLESKDVEIQNALDEKYRSDGEVKYLRQTLQKKEAEIEQLRGQKNSENEQWKKKQLDIEKKLKGQVDKLTSEALFKEKEYQESIQMLEKQLKDKKQRASPASGMQQSQEAKGLPKTNSPVKKAVKPSPPSKLKQQQKGDDALNSSQMFPTQSSFMERPQGQSPKAKTSLVLRQTKSVSCQAQTVASLSAESPNTASPEMNQPPPCHPKRGKMRRLQISKARPSASSGPGILSELVRPSGTSASEGEPGLPGLLQALSTSLTLDSLTYSRNKDNSFLSPLKPHRRFHLPGSSVSGGPSSSSGGVTSSNLVQVVCPENFHLAIQGLDMLLHGTRHVDQAPGNKSQSFLKRPTSSPSSSASSSSSSSSSSSHSRNVIVPEKGPSTSSKWNKEKTSDVSSSTSSSLSSSLSQDHPQYGAILLLPMLSDYLQHYLHNTVAKNTTITAGTKSPATTPVTNVRTSSSSASHHHHTQGHKTSHSLHHSGLDSVSLYAGSSSSYDSSLDSLSSSVLHLLQEGKVYAATMEKYAISALQCLSLLIELCPFVTPVMAHPSVIESKSSNNASDVLPKPNVAATESAGNKAESGTDADDEKSTSSSEIRIIARFNTRPLLTSHPSSSSHSPISLHNQSHLLVCVATLAAENLEESSVSPLVVGESLKVLNQLCQKCSPQELLSLEHVMVKEALSWSLMQTKHPQVILESQKLCGLLIHDPGLMARLCTKSDHCPVYHMYRLCDNHQVDKLQHHVSTQIYYQHINTISSVISQHRAGVASLMVNSCACTDELVVGTILAMYKIFKTIGKTPYLLQRPQQSFKSTSSSSSSQPSLSALSSTPSPTDPTTLSLLLQGILVLHCLAQADGAFCQRHRRVQLSYVRLLSGLVNLIKPIRSHWEWHATLLDELCEFEPEFREASSQDSDNEDKMDQT